MSTVADPLTDEALEALRTLTGDPGAEFRDGQLEAIRDVVVDRARVLCVQRTGWGKSAVYFVATTLLRRAGAGPDADRLAAAGADAQPAGRGPPARPARAHDQLDQPGRVGRRA